MSLKETMQQLDELLACMVKDLGKSYRGNKAAAQRLRVGTIHLEKIGKIFRKESVAFEKGGKKRPSKTKHKRKKR
jgi:hypothetical protein